MEKDPDPSAGGPPPPPSLSGLVMSLAAQAMSSMGVRIDEKIPAQKTDLAQTKYLIDLVAVLEEKTRGAVTPDEAALFRHLLHDLRMAFVERSKA